jgi:hypothetical protein
MWGGRGFGGGRGGWGGSGWGGAGWGGGHHDHVRWMMRRSMMGPGLGWGWGSGMGYGPGMGYRRGLGYGSGCWPFFLLTILPVLMLLLAGPGPRRDRRPRAA